MKKTKVIATIGPASDNPSIIREMILNGMNIARVNMSHATHAFLKHVVEMIDEVNQELHTTVSVMVDTNGPSIQVGRFEGGSAVLQTGDKIRLYEGNMVGDHTKFSVSYKGFIDLMKEHTTLKINDGLIELFVVDKGHDYLLCEVKAGGLIEDYKKVNVIGVKLPLSFLTEKDREDILYASKLHVDYLALSFVSSEEDVLEVNDLLINADDSHMTVISKIENANALEELDNIMRSSDGIMVARGDLGVELPLERIPGIQKKIINQCHYLGKVSIVATEMMATMEEQIRPTRAEVSDVAGAVSDGVDCVMLSGETTVGRYPIEALQMMSKVVESAEEDMNQLEMMDSAYRTEKQDVTGAIAFAVVDSTNKLKANLIVTPTMSGYTARKLSRFRPSCPILALSPDMDTVKSLNIYYGVYSVCIEDVKTFDKMMKIALEKAKSIFQLAEGEKIVITGGYPFQEVKHTNFMKIEEL